MILDLRQRAYYEVREAIRKGILERGECERRSPECAGRIEAHHTDYSKPLDVTWLCRWHHRQLHDRQVVTRDGIREKEAHVA